MNELVIATRSSKLALWQAEHVQGLLEKLHPGLKVTLQSFKTKGDKILDTPLAKIGGKGLFTKELEEAMKRGDAHLAVHSLKDVPVEFEEGFVLAGVMQREDERDAFLSEKYENVGALPESAVVGTTSLRRKMQLLRHRPDLIIKDLRGNVQTRLSKLKNEEYDAIILALAGVRRMNLSGEVTHCTVIDPQWMIPAMGQGALGLEIRNDARLQALVDPLRDPVTELETGVEREFVATLEGGCQVPIGVHAKLEGEALTVRAIVGLPDGSELLEESFSGTKADAPGLGERLAQKMIERGAKDLLERAYTIA